MEKIRCLRTALLIGAMAFLGTACGSDSAESGDDGSVAEQIRSTQADLLIPYPFTGGISLAVNSMNKILVDEGILSHALPTNNLIPGASGMVGTTRLAIDHRGESNTIMLHTTNIVAAPILQASGITHKDITPIARLFSENTVFLASASGRFKSLDDVATALREDVSSVIFGGGSAGSADHRAAGQFALAVGVDDVENLKYVPYDGSEYNAALLGGHIDVLLGGPDTLSLTDSGDVIALGIAAPGKVGGLAAGVPTLKEQGYDVVSNNARFILGPPEMPEAAVDAWKGVFEEMFATEAWKSVLEENTWADVSMTDGLAEELDAEVERLKDLLIRLGLVE